MERGRILTFLCGKTYIKFECSTFLDKKYRMRINAEIEFWYIHFSIQKIYYFCILINCESYKILKFPILKDKIISK